MNLLQRLNKWIKRHYIPNSLMDNPLNQIHSTSTTQEDMRTIDAVKRTRKAFEQQAQQIHMRSLKQHQCEDPIGCVKEVCFVWQRDKIVSISNLSEEEIEKKKINKRKNNKILKQIDNKSKD